MPFAVSCRSCGARFSVGDDLYKRRIAGRIVTVRCKHCQASIRLDASEPPAKPAEPKVERRPKWVPKPAPPPPKPPNRQAPRAVAPSPGPHDSAPVPREPPKDLFQSPPPSDEPPANATDGSVEPVVDLTEFARSEPPPRNATPSDTPGLFELAHERKSTPRASEDVEFLLGLRADTLTTGSLGSPPLPTFDEISFDAEPQKSPSAASPKGYTASDSAPSLSPSASPPPVLSLEQEPSDGRPAKRRWPAVLFALASLAIAAIAVLSVRGWKVREERVTARPNEEPIAPADARTAERATVTEPPTPMTAAPATSEEPEPAPTRAPPPAPTAQPRAPAAQRVTAAPATPEPTEPTTAPADTPPPSPASPSRETVESMATEPFDRAAAAAALSRAAEEASACRQPGDPSGTASATVTFAPSGRVTTATLSGPPFAGTKTGGCIAASLRRARVPAFAGEKVTVGKTIVIR